MAAALTSFILKTKKAEVVLLLSVRLYPTCLPGRADCFSRSVGFSPWILRRVSIPVEMTCFRRVAVRAVLCICRCPPVTRSLRPGLSSAPVGWEHGGSCPAGGQGKAAAEPLNGRWNMVLVPFPEPTDRTMVGFYGRLNDLWVFQTYCSVCINASASGISSPSICQ